MKATRLSLWEQNSEIKEVFTLWLEALEARGIAPRTLENYREGVSEFVAFLEPHATTLDAVQPAHIRKWLLHKQRKGVSPYTVRNAYRLPRLFWRWCLREELTANDPFQKVEKPKVPPKVKPALTPEEVEAILKACAGKDWFSLRDKALILLLLDTGLRIHEAHALTVEDASQDAVLIRGKGGKQRVVFLSHEVRLALRRYLNACPFASTGDAKGQERRTDPAGAEKRREGHRRTGRAEKTPRTARLPSNLRHLEPAQRHRPRTTAPTDGALRLHGTTPIPCAGGSRPETGTQTA